VPHLRCFGYLFDRGEPTIGYSGDTRQCPGLDEIAAGADAVVLECNGVHPWPTHMDVESVRALRARFPGVRFLLSHLGDDVDARAMEGFTVPDDFETVHV
jgi:ribonuclease BN (tRNA processing enzyme)